jgi:hypothetical protein
MLGQCMTKWVFIKFATILRKGGMAKVVVMGPKLNKTKTWIPTIETFLKKFSGIAKYYIQIKILKSGPLAY